MDEKPTTSRPVVVGLDDSPGGRAALRFALEEGLARGTTVEIVTTWIMDTMIREDVTDQMARDEAHVVRLRQEQILAEVAGDLPRVPPVAHLVLHDSGGSPLVEAAADAAMLVVGSGRKGPMARAFLGSVSEFCVRHSPVPVVVVPDPSKVAEHVAHDLVASRPA
ncbi:universal stress protein [Marmoricola sp. RAF53]|uniref:universal stress protein n=1 Tax=Marmoricola sp. RAF53 TaxID=3233059 RepID=UPI003F9D6746